MTVQTDAPAIPVSWGELFDKIAILRIKRERLTAASQLANVVRELDLLETQAAAAIDADGVAALLAELRAVNEALWEIEDALRGHERRKDFGDAFVALARAVYHRNDERAAIKRRVNALLASPLVEEKSYQSY